MVGMRPVLNIARRELLAVNKGPLYNINTISTHLL
jgi:hypothetical protein